MSDASKEMKSGVWRQRRRRVVTGLNVLVAVVLMGIAVVLLNVLVSHFSWHLQLKSGARHELSERTLSMLKGLDTKVDIIAFLASDSTDYDDVRSLLHEYVFAAEKIDGLTIDLQILNPSRDIAQTRDLARKYDVDREDVIVFACGGRKKYVEVNDLVKYKIRITKKGISKEGIGFLGEQAFSSAILGVTQKEAPVIYFVKGHGERDIDDFGRHGGYSDIARIMRRDTMDVRTLQFADVGGVPKDCSLLVVAGPDRKYSDAEVKYIEEYLKKRHGRALFLLDPSANSGLEGYLRGWGVGLGKGVAAGLTLTGRELVVNTFGDHPITRSFKNMNVMLYMPRPVEKLKESAGGAADRAKVTVLASTGPRGWVEKTLSQDPPRFDKGVDGKGPVSVAVAVEKGGGLGVDVEIAPTRMVVIGDSYFVSNEALYTGVGGNSDFFMSSINWLVDRDSLLRVSPRAPFTLNPGMSREQWRNVFLMMVLIVPGAIAFMGILVWSVRRR